MVAVEVTNLFLFDHKWRFFLVFSSLLYLCGVFIHKHTHAYKQESLSSQRWCWQTPFHTHMYTCPLVSFMPLFISMLSFSALPPIPAIQQKMSAWWEEDLQMHSKCSLNFWGRSSSLTLLKPLLLADPSLVFACQSPSNHIHLKEFIFLAEHSHFGRCAFDCDCLKILFHEGVIIIEGIAVREHK